MIKRKLAETARRLAQTYPVVAIVGPRQSGKTTLSREVFPHYKYISLEDLGAREDAESDPKGFVNLYRHEQGVIIDEFQHVPALLSYIQLQVDENRKPGHFILTGSQNFLMNKAISQTLAGRVALITLLPLSIPELKEARLLPGSLEELVFKGSYPELYVNARLLPVEWYQYYIRTYVERDVRDIKKIDNLSSFIKFMKLCAARTGQVINYSSLAVDADIDVATVKSWLSVLEASYIIFFLQPYSAKFTRRLIKSPKLFFYDAGLASSLLGLDSVEAVRLSPYRGNLIESLIISDIAKLYLNENRMPRICFLRDKIGHEIDCVLENGSELIPIEIKAKATASMSLFEGLKFWQEEAKKEADIFMHNGFVVYAGDSEKRTYGDFLNWQDIDIIGDVLFNKSDH